ncbi:hypothetical protein [Oscillatoria sp. FACHB-1406]|uniref:hypothetical protein n=1 Tax=Oscillatoria sp. FACHB-1406 TaxID=2692846 RepID=UPI0019ACAB6D|nr:hypothetical protein [Oscillatoria sp. FACHB-1406]MBD2579862.1 hypothetical protein [Oscillatoria sp. FACHB-1406]
MTFFLRTKKPISQLGKNFINPSSKAFKTLPSAFCSGVSAFKIAKILLGQLL